MARFFTDWQRLMFITHRTETCSEIDETRMALEGGCNWIQLRMKASLTIEIAKEVVRLCRNYNPETIVCINDDVEMAMAAGADAAHIGKMDMSLKQAREIVDKHNRYENFRIGVTANTFEDIQEAVADGASYIGLGPYRFTDTKKNLSPVLGLEGYKDIMSKCREAGIDIPIYAIGGIEVEDVGPLMQTGIFGVAVSGAIIQAEDPAAETRCFLQEINTYI